jgi:hypothetical protein
MATIGRGPKICAIGPEEGHTFLEVGTFWHLLNQVHVLRKPSSAIFRAYLETDDPFEDQDLYLAVGEG